MNVNAVRNRRVHPMSYKARKVLFMDNEKRRGGVLIPRIMLPDEKVNMKKWSVVACDQYTSDHGYWQDVEKTVGNAPSTLHMMLPEIYLNEEDVAERIEFAKQTMLDYIEDGVLTELPEGFMLVERSMGGVVRKGLIACIDLEEYDYDIAKRPLIRATEDTLLERIPPRVDIRSGAAVELPHVLLLMDDPTDSVIGTLAAAKDELKEMYDFDLMKNGGHIKGWLCVNERLNERVLEAIEALPLHDGMRFAVGDGNHSLATAKTVWENAKLTMSEEETTASPLRYALAEIINLRDEAVTVKPIHRAIMKVSPAFCIQRICDILNERGLKAKLMYYRKTANAKMEESPNTIYVRTKQTAGKIELTAPSHPLAVGDIQPAFEQFLKENPASRIEYLHGDEQFDEFANTYDTAAFYMPPIDKAGFFDTVISCGVLPKKTFSLGEANEKRYYTECRLLKDTAEEETEEKE